LRLHKFQTPELIVRDEFNDLLYTDADITPLFVPFFYKRFIRTDGGEKIPCPSCNTTPSGIVEGSLDCPYCESTGYRYEEGISDGWFYSESTSTARIVIDSIPNEAAQTFFFTMNLAFHADLKLKEGDIILRPELNRDKTMKIPIRNNGMYRIISSVEYASDQTDSEYNIVGLSSIYNKYFKGIIDYEPRK